MSHSDYIFKILLLGDATVGKTSIVVRYIHNKFKEPYVMTIGMEPYSRFERVNGKKVCYSIWDIAGEKRFNIVTPMFYRSVQASLVVFDLTQRSSFENTKKWIEEAKKESPDQIFILIGNKNDLDDQRTITEEEGQARAKELGAHSYMETSALTGNNIEIAFSEIGNTLLSTLINS